MFKDIVKILAEKRDIDIIEFEGITFHLARRRVRRARVEFVLPRPLLVVPLRARPQEVLRANRESIHSRYARMCAKWRCALQLDLLDRSEEQTRALTAVYVERYSRMLQVECRQLTWRRMTSRWGTCSGKGVIRLNRFLRHVPEPLVAYVVFHETLHLANMRHDCRFRRSVAQVFPHYRELDRQLELYGIRMRHPDLGTVLVSM